MTHSYQLKFLEFSSIWYGTLIGHNIQASTIIILMNDIYCTLFLKWNYNNGTKDYQNKLHLQNIRSLCKRSILVIWLECRFLDIEVNSSKSGISMLCP